MLPVDMYGNDRLFVNFTVKGAEIDEDTAADLADMVEAGHPVITIELENQYSIAKEFFRWEFATAIAGSIIGINPFDQPDVESAKVETRSLTETYETSGSLPDERPFFEENGIKLFSSEKYAAELQNVVEEESLAGFIESHLWNIKENDYFAILAYVEMDEEHEQVLQEIRSRVLEHYTAATCLGFGPRFLHSTGQAYKGGANNGVFLQITSGDQVDIPVPGQKYTFGVVKAAQARGDFQVLLDRGRRALRIHIDKDLSSGLDAILNAVH
jgi:transaldolase/glucose-6-phosphate isomerase